jgi:hypothetical protein
MTIAIKPTASGSTIEQNGSTILTVDGSGNIDVANNLTVTGSSPLPSVPTFSAYLSADQSFSSSTWTKAAFDIEEFDTNSDYDNATNYRFQPTVAGYYQVNTNVRINYSGSASDYTIVHIWKNGAVYGVDSTIANVTGNWGGRATGAVFYMNGSTDYLEVFVYANHGSPFLQAVNNTCRFSAALVSV